MTRSRRKLHSPALASPRLYTYVPERADAVASSASPPRPARSDPDRRLAPRGRPQSPASRRRRTRPGSRRLLRRIPCPRRRSSCLRVAGSPHAPPSEPRTPLRRRESLPSSKTPCRPDLRYLGP
ncbi:hypothetical protein GUJ93_ZPchr0009g2028 [Zizania palustris]|uniref:Uncharacterized protein n=1 Tax=Zizania palustris TaxID=103762 RepID=A0A8J5VJS6_ZIZPA|nr:hypothetical protein GUJ93_ZPchr0009g2028 [Zizania palustris]